MKELEPAPDWIAGFIDTSVARIPVVNTVLKRSDRIGARKVRLGIGRDDYKVPPGLYAAGTPDAASPVLVTANYKLTFDCLRSELSGINAWIAVIDTKGINVWCAAGKGTFGTAELAGRVNALRVKKLVQHNVLILPQLGAPGIAAHEVFRLCGFRVVYGPVRAWDIKEFLKSGMKATPEMRRVHFGLKERAVLAPIELIHNIKPMLFILFVLFLLNLVSGEYAVLATVVRSAFLNFAPFFLAFFIGCVVTPVLLPWIPFHSFALKGLLLGFIPAAAAAVFPEAFGYNSASWLIKAALLLIIPVIASFLSLNFTGSTTYTSLSGVKKEMKFAIKPYAAATALGLLLIAADTVIRLVY